MRAPLGFIAGCILTALIFLSGAAEPQGSPKEPQSTVTESSAAPQETARPYYSVIKVIDGDTLTIDRDGVPTTLRLIGLDTPESSTTRTGSVECFGHEATEYARALLSSTSFAIETDNTQDTYDRYGRLLVYAYLPDGTLINKKMIEDGFGHEYTYRVPYRYQSEFKAAEAAAREERRGLWAPGTCPTSAAPQKQSAAAAVPSSGTYECSKNVYNCSSFSSQSEAQTAFDACGGSSNDVHKLDGNGDGEVCESLP